MRIDGKIVVLTGAEGGIGREIAVCCAEAGAQLVLSGLSAEGLSETKEAIAGLPDASEAVCFQVDITNRDAVNAMLDSVQKAFGRIDAVVANAGIITPQTSVLDITERDWQQNIAVNLTGTFNTVQAAARLLVAQGHGGTIIATGSSTAVRVMPGFLPYVTAKSGIHGMMRLLALELAPHHIRVNTLVPGTTATALAQSISGHLEKAASSLPMGEVVEPKELGRYVAFAISDAVPHMTGAQLIVDSGRSIA